MDVPDLARVAGLIADPARARILRALLDGTMRPAGELAYAADISAQSASAHLAKLTGGGLLTLQAQGRHRYFRIASPQVAHAIESLGSLGAARVPREPAAARAAPPQFLRARTCYDHLAGEVAVQLCDAMLKARWLATDGAEFRVTRVGEAKLGALEVDLAAARRARRAFANACVDLTQRRPHLGGALGAGLLQVCLERRWVLRMPRSRAVSVTPRGSDAFARLFA